MGRHVRPSHARHALRRLADRLRARAARIAAALPGREVGAAAGSPRAARRGSLAPLAGIAGLVVTCALLLWLFGRPVGDRGPAGVTPAQLATANGSSSAAAPPSSTVGAATASTTASAAPTPVAPPEATRSSTAASAATTAAPGAAAPALRWPISGRVLAGFGWAYSPVFRDWQEHTGVDLQGSMDAVVGAPASGVVTAVRDDPLWGWLVSESLSNGYSTNISGLGSAAVTSREQVEAGQPLGVVGPAPAAEANLPPHVFWQLFQERRPVNPLTSGA